MDMYFDKYYAAIGDSMNEQQFAWKVLAPLVEKVQCGHTSVSYSKNYTKWLRHKKFPSFPLYLKVWEDSMVVMLNLNRNDSILKRGSVVTAVNGLSTSALISRIFDCLPQDGYASSNNYIRMSSNFPYFHRNIFGLSKNYDITYLDSTGAVRHTNVPLYTPSKDSIPKKISAKKTRPLVPRAPRLEGYRSLKYDSSGKFAVMTVNSFSKGKLRRFFRQSFRDVRKKNVENLVLDIRYNGGGRVGLSTLLTRYVTRKEFRVADSLFAVSRNLAPYTKHIKGRFFNNLEMFFISRKKSDGKYHISHLEKKVYKPKRKNHFGGELYVITAGPTFSAASLFSNVVKGQKGITLVGEETGGGWYGNNGIMIPDITLPHTKLRVRLPLFRLVQFDHVSQKGTGIIPDVYVGPHYDALVKGYDRKMQVVRQLIMQSRPSSRLALQPSDGPGGQN